jgi:hypothetical protein
MMAMFGDAHERTKPEFVALLNNAGLKLARVIPTSAMISILEVEFS